MTIRQLINSNIKIHTWSHYIDFNFNIRYYHVSIAKNLDIEEIKLNGLYDLKVFNGKICELKSKNFLENTLK